MSHKTMIDGVAYEISGGKTLVGGTAYSIDKGKTLVGGTAYSISFFTPPALADCTPAEIQAIAKSGQAANYWAVGDTIGITLNGTITTGNRSVVFSNELYYAFIIGFNHNSGIEGSNTIHFQFGKTSSGVDIAFVDSAYNAHIYKNGWGMANNIYEENDGGWESSLIRTIVCPAFLSAMPTEWQNVIVACTKYSDNICGSNTASNVTATSDKIWLLSEFEVMGVRTYANSAEQNYQKRYDYYKNGNSMVKYKHNDAGAACDWWTRSADANGSYRYATISSGGTISRTKCGYSQAIAPGFMVA